MATCTTHVSPVIYVPLGAPGLPSDEPDISSPHCVLIARLNPEFDTRGAHICFKIPMLLRFIVRFGRLTHEIHVRKGCRRIHFWPGREVVLSRRKPKICYHRTFPDVEYIPACGNVFCRCSSLELWAILTPVFSRSRRTVGGAPKEQLPARNMRRAGHRLTQKQAAVTRNRSSSPYATCSGKVCFSQCSMR